MKTQFVYAELPFGIPISALEDAQVVFISDGSVFLVTTLENSFHYSLDFYPVDAEAMEAYGLDYQNGRVVRNSEF